MPAVASTVTASKSHRPASVVPPAMSVWVHSQSAVDANVDRLAGFVPTDGPAPLGRHPGWLPVLRDALGHRVHLLEARAGDATAGILPLAEIRGPLFGRFLVSLPYLNSNGILATSNEAESALVGRAVELADDLGVRYLELRHEKPTDHPALAGKVTNKVHMRLQLPATAELLWKQLDGKVRNQVRKGEKNNFAVVWGGHDLLDEFYAVLAENMRDLGTPVYGRKLFAGILTTFPNDAELCVVRSAGKPIAAAMLLHGPGVTEVPTASSLRAYNPTCANMMMYRQLLDRAIGRGQAVFDFGRSTLDGGTFKYKKQWGAEPHPAVWEYYTRTGDIGEMRPDNPRYDRVIRMWQKLPVWVTKLIGPPIVRGIP